MLVLVGCEESQAVCKEFRALGHEAYSCDLEPCSGGHPEWHLQIDIFEAIKLKDWDLGLFFPPCTYLSGAGIGWCNVDKYGQKAVERIFKRHKALELVLRLYYADIPRIAIENPVGYLSSAFRKPDQVIQPYFFGDDHHKPTCLWLKNLPLLVHRKQDSLFELATHSPKPEPMYVHERKSGDSNKIGAVKNRYFTDVFSRQALIRSKTFPGVAKAMAMQWSNL